MMVILLIILTAITFSFIILRYSNIIAAAYVIPIIVIDILIVLSDFIIYGYMDPWTPIALVLISFIIFISCFFGHMIWVFYCLKTGKNIKDIKDLE